MNFNKSYKLLNLDSDKIYDFKIIKKHYHFLALKCHPDKSNDIDSNEKFQEINKAYNYLYEFYNNNDMSNNDMSNNDMSNNDMSNNDMSNNIINYDDLLKDFLKLLNLKNNDEKDIIINYFKNKYNYYNSIILNKLSENNYFKNLLEKFYNKNNNYNLIIINTQIDNILNDEIYKLELNNDILYIPLWYKEVIYENYLIQIKINDLNNNIKIDEDNNIYISLTSSITELIDKNLHFNIGKKEYFIGNNRLYMKKIYDYSLDKCGIINPLCDVSELQNLDKDDHRSNVYIRLILE